MTGRALTRNRDRGALHRTGSPTLLRMVALEYLKTFDDEKVAAAFDTEPKVVQRIMQRPDIQAYISQRLLPIEELATLGARQLLEAALKTALDPKADVKERTENRKFLAKTLLPTFQKISVEHRHYVEAPPKEKDMEDWAAKYRPPPPVLEAEIIDE